MSTLSFRRTRLAPTPSGFLHIGNAYSFALTAALAKKTGASVLLRIDDMDRERVQEAYIHDIFETLSFLGIPWQEGPKTADEFESRYSQRHRLPIYNSLLQRLRDNNLVYACECSRAQIQQSGAGGAYPGTCRHKAISLDAPNVSWRLRTDPRKIIHVRTVTGEVISGTLPPEMQDVIVRKKDGYPAYQLTSLADDLHYNIDLVVRGQDLWASTLAQLHLAEMLDETSFLNTAFYHHPLLTDARERKLSKSAGDTSIRYLRQQGWRAKEVYAHISRQMNAANDFAGWEDLESLF